MERTGEQLISVIVSLYNTAPYLPVCLDSICAQTYTNLEIILVDDGSTDGSGAICENYAQQDERITVLHQENRGISVARNNGKDHSSGEYIIFIDSDDYVLPGMIEKLHALAIDYDADMTACEYLKVFNEEEFASAVSGDFQQPEESLRIFEGDENFQYLLENEDSWPSVQFNKLFRRSVFDVVSYKEGMLHEDEFIIHHQLDVANKLVATNQILYVYRRDRPGSIMTEMWINNTQSVDAWISRARFFWKAGRPYYAKVFYWEATHLAEHLVRLRIDDHMSVGLTLVLAARRVQSSLGLLAMHVYIKLHPKRSSHE